MEPGHESAPVNVIAFDMGGTSTDVTLCPGALLTTAESQITDLPLRLPVIDIHTVGAGGGSVAFVDAGGALQVGPRSAGAAPGPACYGRGGAEPTVTDANLVLGRLDPAGFLGGGSELRLDEAAARRVLAELGAALGLTAAAAALGVVRVANATMERALRTVSVERGYDPREFILLPFGGAGPLHACDLAEALHIRRILCPPIPGVLSAYGMLLADVVRAASQAILRQAEELLAEPKPLRAAFDEQRARVLAAMMAERVADVTVTAGLDMRYRGQSYELTVPLPLPVEPAAVAEAVAAFHAAHEQRYGYAMPGEQVEVVTLRVKAAAPGPAVELPRRPLGGNSAAGARLRRKPVWFAPAGPVAANVYDRARLEPGNRFAGPAVVLQYDATVAVAPGWRARVDEWGNLWLET
jgi:N-methylhydantoinase A